VGPQLVLLDHQLPGTTGSQVYRQLVQIPALEHTPVVVTSTLRKRAYAEYTEFPNVVELLPKPFTPELL
jgi:CheY-like chemotaxis protein